MRKEDQESIIEIAIALIVSIVVTYYIHRFI